MSTITQLGDPNATVQGPLGSTTGSALVSGGDLSATDVSYPNIVRDYPGTGLQYTIDGTFDTTDTGANGSIAETANNVAESTNDNYTPFLDQNNTVNTGTTSTSNSNSSLLIYVLFAGLVAVVLFTRKG